MFLNKLALTAPSRTLFKYCAVSWKSTVPIIKTPPREAINCVVDVLKENPDVTQRRLWQLVQKTGSEEICSRHQLKKVLKTLKEKSHIVVKRHSDVPTTIEDKSKFLYRLDETFATQKGFIEAPPALSAAIP
mmetsp:Transcript_12677/g.21886  ORF Transcript_12677/g.21886 Transcript_12677/m.21886 type:complete len:132 (+) Transcript_12677:68-463(+)